jgi:hypothetical protein
VVISLDRNAGRSHDIRVKIVNGFFEKAKELEYLGRSLKTKILFRKKLRAD